MTYEEFIQQGETQRNKDKQFKHRIDVCIAAACVSMHSEAIKDSLDEEIQKKGLETSCLVKGVGCMGLCAAGPLINVDGGKALYQSVRESDVPDIVSAIDGAPVKRLELSHDQPFFNRQFKIALEGSNEINSESLDDYLAHHGYEALFDALTKMSPQEVIEEVIKSGLRGRGGGGYPTGLKWTTVHKSVTGKKIVICNGDEGDPGAFMDRAMLESNPHKILEGMAIAAYAVGADQGYIYVRAEYPLAIKRLKTAIKHAERNDYLGTNILGTPFNFSVEIRLGAGAFVCGEETALIASIEGKRGMPRPRPPYPAQEGLWGNSTLINNVETFANIVPIIKNGGEWFAELGTEKSNGTKVFALAGSIKNTGLIEVQMGITLREVVFDIGGGIIDGRKFKAVQTGGPSGGCIPEAHLDMQIDYESLTKIGSMMGSGGMIVMDDRSCMVDVAKYFMDFCRTESCGRCVPCRVGTAQMHMLLTKITDGSATMHDLELLRELCDVVHHTSLCGLGQSASNPVLSTLRFFEDEYHAHIEEKRCPAGVCKIKKDEVAVS
jgi:bidirectional [NiFe] hydrogenase diaphorase subunit